MRKLSDQTGFELVAVAVIVAIFGIVGFAGYKVYQNRTTDSATTAARAAVAVPATIKTKADLSAAAQSLDNASAQVTSSVNGDGLDADINDLL